MSVVEPLVLFVDAVIVLGSIVLLFSAIWSGWLKSTRLPIGGRNLLLIGVGITVAIHSYVILFALFNADSFSLRDPHFRTSPLFDWLFWISTRLGFALITIGAFVAIFQQHKESRFLEEAGKIAESAQQRLVQSEARFQQLLESSASGIFCYSFDPPIPTDIPVADQLQAMSNGFLTECNRVYANDLGYTAPEQVLNSLFKSHNPVSDFDRTREFFRTFIENGYVINDHEVYFSTAEGEEHAYQITLSGIVSNRRLLRIWGGESNVLAWRRTANALQRKQAYQALLGQISSKFVTSPMEDSDAVVVDCLRHVCDFIGAERAALISINWNDGLAIVDHTYTKGNDPPPAQMPLRDFPRVTRNLINSEVTLIEDVEIVAKGAEVEHARLASLGVRSVVLVPLVVANDVVGVATYASQVKPRFWVDDDVVADLRVFAELFANYLLRVRSRRDLDKAIEELRAATERLEAENVYLRSEVEQSHSFEEIVGDSPAIRRCLHLVERVADTDTPVLILGETGTGKELIARALHERSGRRERPLVKVNCAALPGSLIESELFGYEKGAFTGATSAKRGRFDLANGSTLFLDEIGELPLELQPKLLRVLQEGEYERLGGDSTIKTNARIIAATNQKLADQVKAGKFRADLYYRINTFPIELPPLRDRGDDIQLLAEHFVRLHSMPLRRKVDEISAFMMQELQAYEWPGNVRELEGVIQRALIATTGPVLELADPIDDVSLYDRGSDPDLKSVERDHILSVLERTRWKIAGESGAAAMLDIPPSTLRSKMKKLGISRPQ